ncbi:hypothetical protein W97_03966 [Coniosporium apollinis CBS 100218]|uniref:Fungal-specific transcription factor domain-containing protein n=1 Tax=Coniosporium apollinis (strain CBS 100218) TaxID=1168221 RepID=R7YSB8_CONA1|nr:uncharacterized protein W97_03966 [Coniosporium apollinis CBS 100218]EON64733.1 hypothetical protein W97_03966 [Coniosporium apollinis CBS 100218]
MACGPSRPLLHPSPLQRLQTSLAPFYDDAALSASTGSLSTFSDSDYPSPYEFPQTPDEYPFTEPHATQYADPFNSYWGSASSTESPDFQGAPRSYPMPTDEMSSSMRSEHSNRNELDDYEIVEPISFNPAGFSEIFYNGEISVGSGSLPEPAYPYNFSTEQNYEVVDPSLASNASIPRSLYPAQVRQISHRMQYLFDYYDKAICPVLVAFDGPSNPYRMHVLHLAMGSESLQNAIAALSTNNIRMRSGQRTQQIQSPNIPQLASPALTNEEFQAVHGEPGPEEQSYKLTSIQLLNSQLADPVKAKDDSVLATVLILCLFHVCDSGFTKFKTQLAGVQKLLSMRDRRVQSGFLGWVEMFFTWFDVMTSTVNDREMQLSGDSLDMRDLSANLGALEHLAGCEGRLFKLIARLGRLNLLSQNRPVREQNDRTPRPSPPRPSPLPKNGNDFFSINYSRLDGNGWGTPITESPPAIELTSNVDLRHEFWSEWRDIRDRLQEWEMDSPPPAPLSCSAAPPALSPSQCDLLHISESFRFSALLYIERLAHPSLPPSALNFQSLVAQALYHITQIGVTSCVNKFLLWPLFITGTECVDEGHRSIVRQRCVEIQRESGFFNNLSGLEVLERTWREDDVGGPALYDYGTRRNRQAFRWRKAMDRTDGEYIVI